MSAFIDVTEYEFLLIEASIFNEIPVFVLLANVELFIANCNACIARSHRSSKIVTRVCHD